MQVINVVKPFVFSTLPEGEKLAIEKKFDIGKHEITDETANHPWIKDHFADGCIETPQAAKKKTEMELETDARIKAEAAKSNTEAASAMKRATASREVLSVSAIAQNAELNTPVNVLKARRGS